MLKKTGMDEIEKTDPEKVYDSMRIELSENGRTAMISVAGVDGIQTFHVDRLRGAYGPFVAQEEIERRVQESFENNWGALLVYGIVHWSTDPGWKKREHIAFEAKQGQIIVFRPYKGWRGIGPI